MHVDRLNQNILIGDFIALSKSNCTMNYIDVTIIYGAGLAGKSMVKTRQNQQYNKNNTL